MLKHPGGRTSRAAIRVPRDILDNCAMGNNTYNATLGTSKHVGASWTNAQHLQETPEFSNRLSPSDWKDACRPDLLTEAVKPKKATVFNHVP